MRRLYEKHNFSIQPPSILGQSKTQPLIDQKPVQSGRTKEIFIKFEDEYCLEPWEDTRERWPLSRKKYDKQAKEHKKQIRSHTRERRGSIGKFEPKYLEEPSSKNTINYLKQLLAYLKTSTDRKNSQRRDENIKLPTIPKTSSSTIAVQSIENKENSLKGEPSWFKVPVLRPVRGRKKAKQCFTLDKLIC